MRQPHSLSPLQALQAFKSGHKIFLGSHFSGDTQYEIALARYDLTMNDYDKGLVLNDSNFSYYYKTSTQYETIAQSSNFIYCLGHDFRPPSVYLDTIENTIYVGKTDTSLNGWIWYKYIRTPHCYQTPYKIIATSDGSCMITASIYDFVNSPNLQHDVYIIKLDGNGGITHVTNLTNNSGKSVSVYPVPAQRELFLSYSGNKSFDFLMYEMAGRLVSQHKSLNRNNEKIFIGGLPRGHYVYQINFSDGRRETGKIIKE